MIVAIVQARTGSTRLPNKVMLPIAGKPMVQHVIEAAKKAKLVDKVVLATTHDLADDDLGKIGLKCGAEVVRGAHDDVLDRFYSCAIMYNADLIVRLTGDCPLLCPSMIDLIIAIAKTDGWDYIGTPNSPDGLDIEVFTLRFLEDAWRHSLEREHVTTFMQRSNWKTYKWTYLNSLKMSIDTKEDLEYVRKIFKSLEKA